MSTTIRIPATIDAAITPNSVPISRAGVMKKRRLQEELKSVTVLIARTEGPDVYPPLPWALHYTVAWGRNRKTMDDDNLKASLKYVQDGIADEVGIDDKHVTVGTVTQTRDPEGLGYIEVTIEGEAQS